MLSEFFSKIFSPIPETTSQRRVEREKYTNYLETNVDKPVVLWRNIYTGELFWSIGKYRAEDYRLGTEITIEVTHPLEES